MAKDAGLGDSLQFLGLKGAAIQAETAAQLQPETTEDEKYKAFSVRLTEKQYAAARQYFKNQGIPLAVGVRSLILERLKKDKII